MKGRPPPNLYYAAPFMRLHVCSPVAPCHYLYTMSPYVESFLSYIEYERRYSKHTIESYRNDLEQLFFYLKSEYQKEEIELATHLEIRSWMVRMMENEISPRSINRKLSTLKSFFKFLMRKGVV